MHDIVDSKCDEARFRDSSREREPQRPWWLRVQVMQCYGVSRDVLGKSMGSLFEGDILQNLHVRHHHSTRVVCLERHWSRVSYISNQRWYVYYYFLIHRLQLLDSFTMMCQGQHNICRIGVRRTGIKPFEASGVGEKAK